MYEFQVKVLEDISVEPVTLNEVKAFCRIDADYTSDDTTLSLIRSSSREKLEGYLNVFFGVKKVEMQFSGGAIRLPYGPTGNIFSIFNTGDDPYADIAYKLHGLTFQTLCIDSAFSPEFFYPMGGSIPQLWRDPNYGIVNTYNLIYNTGYTLLPSVLKHALLIQIDYDFKNQGLPGMDPLSPIALQKAERFSQNLPL